MSRIVNRSDVLLSTRTCVGKRAVVGRLSLGLLGPQPAKDGLLIRGALQRSDERIGDFLQPLGGWLAAKSMS